MHIFQLLYHNGDYNRNSRETPCTLFSRPAAPAISARSNVGGGCTGNVGLLALCITFIKPTLCCTQTHNTHIQNIYMHMHGRNCIEPLITYTNTTHRKRQLLHTWTKWRPVATHTCIHLFNTPSHIISRVSVLINYNHRYKWLMLSAGRLLLRAY